MNRFRTSLCVVALASSTVAVPAAGHATENWVDMNFASPNTFIDAHIDERNQKQNDHWKLFIKGKPYACITKGLPQTPPSLVPGAGVYGGSAVRVELDPTSGLGPDNGRDKINYEVINGKSPNAPGLDDAEMGYFAFAVKLDPREFMTPTTGLGYVIAQWWQGKPSGPPLSLQILPATSPEANPEIAFSIRNPQTGGTPHARTIVLRPKHLTRLERGKWYRFVVGTRFSTQNNAELHVWIDNDREEEISWRGNMGYEPGSSPQDLGFGSVAKVGEHQNAKIAVYFGPYRDRMNSTQVFYFDQVSYGPERPSAKLLGHSSRNARVGLTD